MKALIPNLIISDFDMTFLNFKEVDNKIIENILKGHNIILRIDRLLWKINSLGIIGNSMSSLKLRLLGYSFLTIFTGYIKYTEIYYKYESLYKSYASKKFENKKWIIKKLEEKGYCFVIVTNNKFASELNQENIFFTSKRKYLKTHIPEYLLGDNFWDDYMSCPKETKFINVGEGILSKFNLENVICIDNIYQIFDVL